jgi:hypothetical protein
VHLPFLPKPVAASSFGHSKKKLEIFLKKELTMQEWLVILNKCLKSGAENKGKAKGSEP